MATLPMIGIKASDANKHQQHGAHLQSTTQDFHSKDQAEDLASFKTLHPSMKHVKRAADLQRSNSLSRSESDIPDAIQLSDATRQSLSSGDVRNILGSPPTADALGTHPLTDMTQEMLGLSSSNPSIHAIADVLIHLPGSNHPNVPPQRPISDPVLGSLGRRYLPVSPLVAKDITPDAKLHTVPLEKNTASLSAPGSPILSRFAAKQLLSRREIKRDNKMARAHLDKHMQPLSGSHPELHFISHDLKGISND